MDLIDKITIEEEIEIDMNGQKIITKMACLYLNVIERENILENDPDDDYCENYYDMKYEAEIEFNKDKHKCVFHYYSKDHYAYIDYQKKMSIHPLFFKQKIIKDFITKEMLKNKEIREMIIKAKNKRTKIFNQTDFQYKVFFNENYETYEDIKVNEEVLELIIQIEEEERIAELLNNF